jgi:hypothetical protein
VDLDEILCGGDNTEGDIDHFKLVDITFDVVQLLNRYVDLDEILYQGDHSGRPQCHVTF